MKFPLSGLSILNTRPITQSTELARAIQQNGGTVLNYPGLVIQPLHDTWFQNMPPLQTVKYAIFTSQNAVIFGFKILKARGIIWPTPIRVIAIGQATAHALKKEGVWVHHVPNTSDSEHLLALPSLQSIKNHTILVFKGVGGRGLIAPTLMMRGAFLRLLDVYERIPPPPPSCDFLRKWQKHPPHIVLFTSEGSMKNVLKQFDDLSLPLRDYPCLVLSERLQHIAKINGFQTVLTSAPEDIVENLITFNRRRLHG